VEIVSSLNFGVILIFICWKETSVEKLRAACHRRSSIKWPISMKFGSTFMLFGANSNDIQVFVAEESKN